MTARLTEQHLVQTAQSQALETVQTQLHALIAMLSGTPGSMAAAGGRSPPPPHTEATTSPLLGGGGSRSSPPPSPLQQGSPAASPAAHSLSMDLLASWRGTSNPSGEEAATSSAAPEAPPCTLSTLEQKAQKLIDTLLPQEMQAIFLAPRRAPAHGHAPIVYIAFKPSKAVSEGIMASLERPGSITSVQVDALAREYLFWVSDNPGTTQVCLSPLCSALRRPEEALHEPHSGSLLGSLKAFQLQYEEAFSLPFWGPTGAYTLSKQESSAERAAYRDLALLRTLLMWKDTTLVIQQDRLSTLRDQLRALSVRVPIGMAGYRTDIPPISREKWMGNFSSFLDALAATEKITGPWPDWHSILFHFLDGSTENNYFTRDMAFALSCPQLDTVTSVSSLAALLRGQVTANDQLVLQSVRLFGMPTMPGMPPTLVDKQKVAFEPDSAASGQPTGTQQRGRRLVQSRGSGRYDHSVARSPSASRSEGGGGRQDKLQTPGIPCTSSCPQCKIPGESEHFTKNCFALCTSKSCAGATGTKDSEGKQSPAQHRRLDCVRIASPGNYRWTWSRAPITWEKGVDMRGLKLYQERAAARKSAEQPLKGGGGGGGSKQ